AQVSPEHLDRMPLPAVLHWEGRHWIVLLDVSGARARVADPALGIRWLSRDALLAGWTGYAALFDFTDAFTGGDDARLELGWLWPHLSRFAPVLAQAFFLSLAAAGLTMLLPVVTQVVIDRVVVDGAPELLTSIMGFMGVLFAFMTVARI